MHARINLKKIISSARALNRAKVLKSEIYGRVGDMVNRNGGALSVTPGSEHPGESPVEPALHPKYQKQIDDLKKALASFGKGVKGDGKGKGGDV